MYKNYLDYVCCPECKNNLIEQEGSLVCGTCTAKYDSTENIPILMNKSKLNKHLLHQVEYFENEMTDKFSEYKLEAWQESYLKRFLENFGDMKNVFVLDCGVGSGYMSIELAKLGATIVACDLTLTNLIKLKKVATDLNLLDKISFVCCSAEELPFKTDIFDYFISNAVFEHLPKEPEAIVETRRVCKNGAGLMVAVPLSYKYLNPIFLPVNMLHDYRIGHLRRYNEDILVRKLTGFKLIRTYYTGHIKKVFGILVNQFIKKGVFDEVKIEEDDKKNEHQKIFASNIISFFRKTV